MPSQVLSSVENNFTKGLITEYTGLNFPENAATDTENCIYTLVGNVTRRQGIDWETNAVNTFIDRTNQAMNTYKWNNAGGDGTTQFVVTQQGPFISFYRTDNATVSLPISGRALSTEIDLRSFQIKSSFDSTQECTFADGNGYLFIFHPNCQPLYVIYNSLTNSVTATQINVQIRDFDGIPFGEPTDVTSRNAAITPEHQYNLQNQGWGSGPLWSTTSATSWLITTGSFAFTVPAGLTGITAGTSVYLQALAGGGITGSPVVASGSVTSYVGTVLTINVTSIGSFSGFTSTQTFIAPLNVGTINTFRSVLGVYPSNSDIWWYFKNSSGVFDPATTNANISLAGQAPRGNFILPAFFKDRTSYSAVTGLTAVYTLKRPTNGAWFAGRIWYTGVNDSFPQQGDAGQYSWSEQIYFSQVVKNPEDFGNCYQNNNPTSEGLFDLLPTDGGVIQIQGCGSIYKLFPLQNAMLIFAANGVWYLTGSQGIGFTATDYTIVKLSSVRSISSTSFVDIQGLPMFWNEEGIYSVEPAKQGGGLQGNPLHVNPLEVVPITIGTIQTFFDNIPLQSKKYVRGVYNPIDYVVQWIYKESNESNVTDRYDFDRILNYNVYNKSFYLYTLDISNANVPRINGVVYVASPGGSAGPVSVIKYLTSYLYSSGLYRITFADEHDTTYVDWSTLGWKLDYDSFFVTGYKLHGQGQRYFQIPYIYMYSNSEEATSYKIQGVWDYAVTGDSGRWSTAQLVNIFNTNFLNTIRRHKIRGRGLVLQIKVSSMTGMPFNILGWSTFETQNTGV